MRAFFNKFLAAFILVAFLSCIALAQQTATKTFTITVNPSPLVITTSTVPNAQATVAYTFTFTASGGTAPYTWSATGVPAGLSLSTAGVLSGTPTTAGSYSIVITVKDSSGTTAQMIIKSPDLAQLNPNVDMHNATHESYTQKPITGKIQPDGCIVQDAKGNVTIVDCNNLVIGARTVIVGDRGVRVRGNQ